MSSTMSGYSPNKSIRLQDARVPKRGTRNAELFKPQTLQTFQTLQTRNTEHGTQNSVFFQQLRP